MSEDNIKINWDSWECYCCKTIQLNPVESVDKAPFFQVDAVDGDNILLSNYFEQRFVKYKGDRPPLNTPYCRKCVDEMPGLNNNLEREINNYTFKQHGKTCWDMKKCENFSRDCGTCVGCGVILKLKSLFNDSSRKECFFLIWSPHLASRCFPETCSPQVWKSIIHSKFYVENAKPSIVCNKCFQESEWLPYDAPIKCYLCDKRYQRWIFHWAMKPVKDGYGCYCHVYPEPVDGKEVIMDGYVDPEEYEWVGTEKPDNFDPNKPFCVNCLTKLVEVGMLKSMWETVSSDDETL